jgi:hypothetical protein
MSDIDPQEFGELRAKVEILLETNRVLAETVATMSTAIQSMQLQMAEARGGWKTLMVIGGASASFGGLVTGLMSHFIGKGAP